MYIVYVFLYYFHIWKRQNFEDAYVNPLDKHYFLSFQKSSLFFFQSDIMTKTKYSYDMKISELSENLPRPEVKQWTSFVSLEVFWPRGRILIFFHLVLNILIHMYSFLITLFCVKINKQ